MRIRPVGRFSGLFFVAASILSVPSIPFGQQAPTAAAPPQRTLKAETEQLLKEGEADLNNKQAGDATRKFKRALKVEDDQCARCYFDLAAAQDADHDAKGAIGSCDKGIAVAGDDIERAEGHGTKGNLLLSA